MAAHVNAVVEPPLALPVKHLVLLGAGHAHLHVLESLAANPLAAGQVTLVSPFPASTYSGMVPGVVAGHYMPDDCMIRLAPLAERARAARIESAAVALDAAARRITLANGACIGYDVLSIDTGPEIERETIPGAREHAVFVRPIEAFIERCEALFARTSARTLDVVVVGGGAGGVELAMALRYRLGDRARVTLVAGEGAPLAGYAAGARRRALNALVRSRVKVIEDICVEVTSSHVVLGRGGRLECDTAVIAIGASAPRWLRGSGLRLDGLGFVATGPTLQSGSHAEVFAAGDVATRIDAPRAKSGVHAVRAGPPLARNLRRFMTDGVLEPYQPQLRTLNLLSCGARYAIASWGAWSAEGRWVWWWKDRIDRSFVTRYQARGNAQRST